MVVSCDLSAFMMYASSHVHSCKRSTTLGRSLDPLWCLSSALPLQSKPTGQFELSKHSHRRGQSFSVMSHPSFPHSNYFENCPCCYLCERSFCWMAFPYITSLYHMPFICQPDDRHRSTSGSYHAAGSIRIHLFIGTPAPWLTLSDEAVSFQSAGVGLKQGVELNPATWPGTYRVESVRNIGGDLG